VKCKRRGLKITLTVGAKKGEGLMRRLDVSPDPVAMLDAALQEAAQSDRRIARLPGLSRAAQSERPRAHYQYRVARQLCGVSAKSPPTAPPRARLLSLTRSLACEWAQDRISVNAIAPGIFPTELNEDLVSGTARGREMLLRTPMRRFGKPEEWRASGQSSGGYLACQFVKEEPSDLVGRQLSHRAVHHH
jgi:NAD(P)-dependent dehydrogenase (short-subunit alcohol dehydrogenase family)